MNKNIEKYIDLSAEYSQLTDEYCALDTDTEEGKRQFKALDVKLDALRKKMDYLVETDEEVAAYQQKIFDKNKELLHKQMEEISAKYDFKSMGIDKAYKLVLSLEGTDEYIPATQVFNQNFEKDYWDYQMDLDKAEFEEYKRKLTSKPAQNSGCMVLLIPILAIGLTVGYLFL